jgi:hypothetical protein
MARRRVSEEDLLNFRAQAEVLSQEVEVKYEEMDRKKRAEPEPVRDMGLLILGEGEDDAELRSFARRMDSGGLAVERADILGYEPIDRFDRTPQWQRRLVQAQAAYTSLRKRARRVAALGVGQSVPLAALIAEEYPVDALIAVGAFSGSVGERAGKRAPSRIRRIAKRNLFSIVCPILTILPEDLSPRAAASAAIFDARTRSRDVRLLEMRGAKMASLFPERESELAEAIFEFLDEG